MLAVVWKYEDLIMRIRDRTIGPRFHKVKKPARRTGNLSPVGTTFACLPTIFFGYSPTLSSGLSRF